MRPIHRPVLPLLSAALLAAATPTASQVFEERTDVVVVEVPVHVVTRDGEPVRGLAAADFSIHEGKKKHPITGFDVVDLAELTPAEDGFVVSDVRAVARRHFLLLFDLSFSDADSVVKARRAARRLVAEELHPADLVAVAVYAQSHGSRLILGFTSDREQVDLAIASLGAPQIVRRAPETLSLVLGEVRQEMLDRERQIIDRGGRAAERRLAMLDATLGQYLEHVKDVTPGEIRDIDTVGRNQVIALTRSFADLGRLMRGVSGRKHVVYLSEGFDSELLLGGEVAEEDSRSDLQESLEEGALWRVDSDRMYGSSRLQGDLNEMLGELRRADCVIHAVDIGGVRAAGTLGPERGSGEDGLFAMAEGTGGELYRNFNDLGTAMERMLRSTAVTYVLAFEPRRLAADGWFHEIEVRLERRVPGARVIHRQGYFAPAPPSMRTPLEEKLEAAELILAGSEGGPVPLSVLAAPFRGPAGDTFVPVLAEIGGEELIGSHFGGLLSAEIYAYAFDRAGGVAAFLAQKLGINLLEQGDTLRAGGLRFYGELELDPGRYELRVLVRNVQTRGWGLASYPLTVPDYGSGAPVLLGPFPLASPEGWLLARAEGGGGFPYPFVLEGRQFVPAARLRVAPGEERSLCLMAYGGGRELTARVLTAGGGEAPGGSFQLLREAEPSSAGVTRMTASFRPEGLAPGEYTLAVAMTDPASGRTAESAVPLVVEER